MSETKTFVSQTENLKQIESIGGTAEYVVMRPETVKEGSLPVLVAGGWSEGSQSLRDTAEEIYEDGREVILVDHARSGGFKKDEVDINPEVAHKAHTLLSVINELGLERVDVIAHSEGALNITVAAARQPEKFRNIILVAPAGMIGKDSVPRLIGRFIPKIIRGYRVDMKEIKARDPESAARFAAAGPNYIKSNVPKAFREIGALATTRIDKSLPQLRQAGIKVGLIQSHADRGFPDKRISEQVVLDQDDGSLEGNIDAYASVASKEAGHDDIIIHPKRTTKAALDMLATFEKLENS